MNLLKFIYLSLCLSITPGVSGNVRLYIPPKLQQSPFGVGVRAAALSRSSPHRHRRYSKIPCRESKPCSRDREEESDEGYTRNAAVLQNESRELRVATLPHLKMKLDSRPGRNWHQHDQMEDELDWLEGDSTPCTRLSVQRASPVTFLARKNTVHRPIIDEESSDEVATTLGRSTKDTRGGGGAAIRPLVFWENMVCGAVSRSLAQTIMHPANTMKTILQSSRGADRPTLATLMRPDQFRMLTRGAGANFLLSMPHGAVNFAVLEFVRGRLNRAAQTVPFLKERLDSIGPALDFTSSAISTICCSVVSTPQMMITDNIMAGNFPNLPLAISGLYKDGGVVGFYRGWLPGLVGKIPSYALTWTFFQQLKRTRDIISDRPAKDIENTIMGSMASAAAVCIMIPMDTIKTRLVTQLSAKVVMGTPYKGIIDCAVRVAKEEGIGAFYRGLPPRLISVVPMIGIQFGVYEAMKRVMLRRKMAPSSEREMLIDRYGPEQALKEVAMEVAASSAQPLPAPRFLDKIEKETKQAKKGRFSRQAI